MMSGNESVIEDGEIGTEDIIRRTYEQLVNTRNEQIKFMANLRQRRNSVFGVVLTPDLIVQYNYAYQLLKSLRIGLPTETCVKDGGVTCSKLSVLIADKTRSASSDRADGSDYLGSRIVDLFDRPISVSDRDLTVNVRDEFASNIKTLNDLFEDRYRLCQEQCGRLKNELTATRRQLADNRAAATDVTSRSVVDYRVHNMRDQIARYEIQTRVIKEQMEALKDMNEKSIERNRLELERLLSVFADSSKYDENDDAIVKLLQRLVDTRETEHKQVLGALKQLKKSATGDDEVILKELTPLSTNKALEANNTDHDKRFQSAIETRVQDDFANIRRDIEARIVKEVETRKSSIEPLLREKLDSELQYFTSELEKNFSDTVAAGIARQLNESVQVVTVNELPKVQQLYGNENRPVGVSNGGDILESTKRVVDEIIKIKSSISNIAQMESARPGRVDDVILVNSIYNYLVYLLGKSRDIYTFMNLQNVYLKITAANAYQHYVPTTPQKEAKRTEEFKVRINHIVEPLEQVKNTNEGGLKEVLEDMVTRIEKAIVRFRSSARNTDLYRKGKKLDELYEQAKKLVDLYQKKRIDPIAAMQRQELELLRSELVVKRSTVRELQLSLAAHSPNSTKTIFGRQQVAANVAQEAIQKEQVLRSELLHDFTRIFVELANYTIRFTDVYDKWYRSVSKGGQVESVGDYIKDLRNVMLQASSVIEYKKSLQYNHERFSKLNISHTPEK